MSGFDVTTAELNAAQVYVSDVAGEIHTGLISVAADVDALLEGGWKGTAAAGFAAGWQSWRSGAAEILDALGRTATLLAVTARTYDGQDAVSRSDFSRLDGGR